MSSGENNIIRVLIADDHAVVRHGLKQILSKTQDLLVAGEAETGKEVLDLIKHIDVDVLVMDIEMPEKSGWDVLLEVQHTHPQMAVLILSIYSEDQFGIRFLKAGASGYLSKTSAPEQLVEAIRRVFRGGKFISQQLGDRLVLELGKDHQKLQHETLSDREFQVFRMLVSGKQLKAIADELCISVATVSTHRARILEKMNMKTNAEMTVYAVKNKLIS